MHKILLMSALILVSFSVATPTFAVEDFWTLISTALDSETVVPPDVPNLSGEPFAEDKTYAIFRAVVRFLLFIAGVGATIMIVVSGIRMMTAAGSDDQISAAKKNLLYAIIGLFAVILSYMIVQNVIVRIFYGD